LPPISRSLGWAFGTLSEFGCLEPFANDMEKEGITRFALALALEGLSQKEYIEVVMERGYNDEYEIYKSTKAGLKWCMDNQTKFALKLDAPAKAPATKQDEEEEDDIPF
jgi:hypothetical protein